MTSVKRSAVAQRTPTSICHKCTVLYVPRKSPDRDCRPGLCLYLLSHQSQRRYFTLILELYELYLVNSPA